jgi:hypothetical protein
MTEAVLGLLPNGEDDNPFLRFKYLSAITLDDHDATHLDTVPTSPNPALASSVLTVRVFIATPDQF